MSSIIIEGNKKFFPSKNENIMFSLFKQYESTIVESLVTSFGLDFLIKDQYGGDVDTIHNVRKIDNDSQMYYKNKKNKEAYENNPDYNSKSYHSHESYIFKNKEVKILKKNGELYDSYTGEKISYNGKTDLDHIISANEIHKDRGRILSGLKGEDLANSPENLTPTNPRTNRTKKADSMDDFLNKYKDEYTEKQKNNMRNIDKNARKSYNKKLNKAYYTSSQFSKDITLAAGNVGLRMGVRQAIGVIFAEIWFEIRNEFRNIGNYFNFSEVLSKFGNAIKNGFEKAKLKYKEIFSKFIEGSIAGAFSSIITTLSNIFFTTSKNIVKILRQTWVSLVKAAKILFINPDNLSFGERMREVLKILSIGASVAVGILVNEAISKTPVGVIPIVGDIIQTFCGTFVTGIMSCTLLYVLDNNEYINKLVKFLDTIPTLSKSVEYFHQQVEYFENYAAEIMNIDIEQFKKEERMYTNFALKIENAKNEAELNSILKEIHSEMGLRLPYSGSFEDFMQDRNGKLVFK